MSATDWSICYNCIGKAQKKLARLNEVAMKPNSPDWNNYMELKKKLQENIYTNYNTLREDYEVYIDEGLNFRVDYRCFCEKCGFSYEYSHSEKLKDD